MGDFYDLPDAFSAPPGLIKPLGVGTTPGFGSAVSGDSTESPTAYGARIEEAIVSHLSKKVDQKESLPKLGLYLRARSLIPLDGLKKFITSRSHLFLYIDEANGTQRIQLISPGSRTAPNSHQGTMNGASSTDTNSGLPPGIDEVALEKHLVAFIMDRMRKNGGEPANMPTVGEYCISKLGFSMKGYLHRFLQLRPHLFALPEDGRQHVVLIPGAAEAVGLNPDAPDVASLPNPVIGGKNSLIGGSSSYGTSSSLALTVCNPLPLPHLNSGGVNSVAQSIDCDPDYRKWDRITQAIYDYLRSRRGAALFRDVETHIRAEYAEVLISQGFIPPSQWKAAVFTYKRRNIFRREGTVLALNTRNANTSVGGTSATASQQTQQAGQPSTGRDSGYSFPEVTGPLSSVDGAKVPQNGALTNNSGANTSRNNNLNDAGLQAAIAEERRELEKLRQEVHARLGSLALVPGLQRENAALRAACVTLGRELLGVKDSIETLKAWMHSQSQSQSQSTSGGGVQNPNWPTSASTFPGPNAATAAAAAAPTNTAVTTTTNPSAPAATTGAGGLSRISPLGSIGVLGSSSVMTMPDIGLIGGHDGTSWLDSGEKFNPSSGAWSYLPRMPSPRSFAAAASSPEDLGLYVVGGGNGVEWYDSCVCLPRGSSEWKALAPMAVPRGSLAAAFALGHLYAFGGGKPGAQYSVVEWYNPQNDRWLTAPDLGSRRFALSGVSLDGVLYAVGGYDGTAYLSSAERLDPREGRWAPIASMSKERGGHACAAIGSEVYALGGYSKSATDECEVYDTRMNAWRTMPSMPACRAYGAATAAGNEVFVVGGLLGDMETHASLVEKFSVLTGTWQVVDVPAHVNSRRSFLAACTLA